MKMTKDGRTFEVGNAIQQAAFAAAGWKVAAEPAAEKPKQTRAKKAAEPKA